MRSHVLLLQRWRWVFSPRYCAMQQKPLFSCGKHFRPPPPFLIRPYPYPARAKWCSFSPPLCKTPGNAPSPSPRAARAPGQIAKGFGCRSPARVPGVGRSCLASILSRYKTRFQKSEPFHWQEMEAAGDGQLPQLRFPARLLSQPRSLRDLQTHAARTRRPDPPASPNRGSASPRATWQPRGRWNRCRAAHPRIHPLSRQLLLSRELVFNDRSCVFARALRHSATPARRVDGPARLLCPCRCSPHLRIAGCSVPPQPSAFGKDAGEQNISGRGANGTCTVVCVRPPPPPSP